MSYTFTVSPLSAIRSLDVPALRNALGLPAGPGILEYSPEQAERFMREVSPGEIIRWWEATQAARIDQLKTPVTWDETSKFEETRDVGSHSDAQLSTLLAYIDLIGTDTLTTGFRDRAKDTLSAATAELLLKQQARGFGVRFPQASLEPEFFLPFRANLILEVPDWWGETTRFGSLPCLARELAAIVALIAAADPAAAHAGRQDVEHEDPLAGAYSAAWIKLALVRVGLRKNLPFWFSE